MKFAVTVFRTLATHADRTKVLEITSLLAAVISASVLTHAQTPVDKKVLPLQSEIQSLEPLPESIALKSLPRNLFQDQKYFWSTPFHMSLREWQWTVPLAFAGAGLLASDTAIEKHVPTNPSTVSHAASASNAGLAAMAGIGGGMFLWGNLAHDDEKREAGFLSGEAGIDAFLDTEGFKSVFGRDRPLTGDGRGRFFQGGNSFPSQHAAISWAIASVIAHEYPGPMTQVLAYGFAGGISAGRPF